MKQTRTPEEFEKIDKMEFYRLWFKKALTLGQIAKMYGVKREEVVAKKKEFNLTTYKCAVLSVLGGDKYK